MTENSDLGNLNIGFRIYKTRISRKYAARRKYTPANPGAVMSFIPGTVSEIFRKKGEAVRKGDILMILDAMKMKNKILARNDGKVKSVNVKAGDRVKKGTVLMLIE